MNDSPQNDIKVMNLLKNTNKVSTWRVSNILEKSIQYFILASRVHFFPLKPKHLPISLRQSVFVKSRNPVQASTDSRIRSFCVTGFRVEQCKPGYFRFTCTKTGQMAAVVSVGQCSSADVSHVDEGQSCTTSWTCSCWPSASMQRAASPAGSTP